MAITLVGTPQVFTTNNGANVTLTFDGTPAQNDVVFVWGGAALAAGPPSINTAGYTTLILSSGLYSTETAPRTGIFYKVLGTTPDASVECNGGGSANDVVSFLSYVLRGVDTSVIVDSTFTFKSTAGGTVALDPPAVTVNTSGAWVIPFACSVLGVASTGFPTGYSNGVAGGSNVDTFDLGIAAATKECEAGTEDPNVFSTLAPWNNGQRHAITVAIRPATSTSTGGGGFARPTPTFLTLGVGS